MRPAAWVAERHPFGETLEEYERGVPVDCGDNWTKDSIYEAVKRGPHTSALTPEAIRLITEDVMYQVDAGFSRIVLWEDLKENMPPNLKVSPLAVVPQTGRRGRLILDLSFGVRRSHGPDKGKIIQPSVNETTQKLSPQQPLDELGSVLPRIFDFMAKTPLEDDIMFSKIDLSDGFWRMIVAEEDAYNFTYVLPGLPGEPLRLVIPHALQMGWTESPGYFCAATETGRDIMTELLDDDIDLPPHPMEHYITPTNPAKRQKLGALEHRMAAVFVDDYCLAAVENAEGTLLNRFGRAALHAINGIFPPPEISGHTGGKHPVSEKKAIRGDTRFEKTKEMLGFDLDGNARTVRLPTKKAEAIVTEIRKLLKKKKVRRNRFQSITGKLQHASLVMPATKPLFNPLYNALKGNPRHIHIPPHSPCRVALRDFIDLTLEAARRPTHVHELIARAKEAGVWFCDASGFGAGGAWFIAGHSPIVWRVVWPTDIQNSVVSDNNPDGALTNSDLELAAIVLHYMVLRQVCGGNTRHMKTVTFSDNTPAVVWSTRMRSKSRADTAYHLLRGFAMVQRTAELCLPTINHIDGPINSMADDASRPIHLSLLSDNMFLNRPGIGITPDVRDIQLQTFFNSRYPLQNDSWRVAHPGPEPYSKVISTLRGKHLPLRQWTTQPATPAGHGGSVTAPWLNVPTPTCGTLPSTNNNNSSSLTLPGFVQDTLDVANKFNLRRSGRPSVTWAKPSRWLGSQTPAAQATRKNWTFPSVTPSKP